MLSFEYNRRFSHDADRPVLSESSESPFLSGDIPTLRAIGRLRYELFIERDGKKYEHADHRNRLFLEPVDFVSMNFSSGTAERRNMAVRLTEAEDVVNDRHLKLIIEHSGLADGELAGTLVMSRFAVRADTQSKLLIPKVLRAVYQAGVISGSKVCLLAARQQMIELTARFGFVACGTLYDDAVAGPMNIMRLDLADRSNLLAQRSPLLKIHDQLLGQQSSARQEEFA